MPYVARRPSKTLAALTACVDAWLRPGAGGGGGTRRE
jgi:hypothetical protein